MKTTLKRGVGRGAEVNGNGHSVFPPGPVSAVTRYQATAAPERSGFAILRRILVGTVLAVIALALGVGGGAYLWFHKSVAAIQAHSPQLKTAQQGLKIPLPGQPAVALVLGYDARPGETLSGSRSDTIMLLRADPKTKTISMLSFPRDLSVPIWCAGREYGSDKINSAFSNCDNGPQGTLQTVKKLTGIDINYIIMVNFHGFRELVDEFGGIWLDIDRRYYNKNTGASYNNYANIDLLPGYQRLAGGAALDFVRFRHTDADFFRLARQQQFVRAFKEQIAQGLNLLDVPKIVKTITKNIEVGGNPSDRDVIDYAYLAATMPSGHFLQVHIDRNQISEGGSDLLVSSETVHEAVGRFVNPDVGVAKIANETALGTKAKTKTPLPKDTTITVLNGNGVAGSAANASYLLGQRGYVIMPPPNGAEPNTPRQNYFETKIYFKKAVPGARAAALALKKRLEPAKVGALPVRSPLRALDPGSMLLVALGTTFPGHLVSEAPSVVPSRQLPAVRADATPGRELLEPLQKRVPFPLQVPTVLEQSSYPDNYNGDKAVNFYRIDPDRRHKAVRLVFRTGGSEYWGIQQTDWEDAPVLSDKSFRHAIGGRSFDLYYSGPHLHMAVLRANGASYWVVNTLLDSLSNETMIAIAKGLRPLAAAK